jgi:hypothetical protein
MFSIYLTHKLTSPKEEEKHVVAFGKQSIARVDGVDDVDVYNNYALKCSYSRTFLRR